MKSLSLVRIQSLKQHFSQRLLVTMGSEQRVLFDG